MQTYAQPPLSPAGTATGPSRRDVARGRGLPVPTVSPEPPAATAAYDSDHLMRLIELFEAAEDASRKNRERAERDIDYYDGKQLTDEEVRELKKRGQPPLTDNEIKPKIEYLQGLERTQRTDPRALPRTPQHEEDAHAATDALRAVCEMNRYDQKRSRAWRDLIRAGWGGVEVTTENGDGPNPRVVIRACQWDRMFWDPYSCEDDYSDAQYLGLVLWMDRDDAIRRYGADAAKVFDETIRSTTVGGTFDDKPKATTWTDRQGKRKRIRVVQMYHVGEDGGWQFCEFTKGGYLQAGPSPWLNEKKQPEHPFSWRSCFVDRDNNRYGLIRDQIDNQDAANKLFSRLLHLFTVRQTYGTEQSLGSKTVRDLRLELAKPDGHVALAPGVEFGKQFGIIPTTDMTAGYIQLLAEKKQAIAQRGPNAAMLGKGPQSASGRSILANQQGGQIEVTPQTDTLRDMDHETYRKVWNRVRQFWTAEEWVRITDDQKNVRFVGLNVPIQDPFGNVIGTQNPVAELDIDIIIDDAPPVGTMLDEQFAKLVDLAKVGVQFPPKVYLSASTLRNKGELMQMLDEATQPNPGALAELENTKADSVNKGASAQLSQARAQEIALKNHLTAAVAMSPPMAGPPMGQPSGPPPGPPMGQVVPFQQPPQGPPQGA